MQHADPENCVHEGNLLLHFFAGFGVEVDDHVPDAVLGAQELLADVGAGGSQNGIDLREDARDVLVGAQDAVTARASRQVDLGEVHGPVRAPGVDDLQERERNLLSDLGLRLLGGAADVRGHQHVGAPPQLRLEEVLAVLARLLREDIHVAAAQVAGLQGRRKRRDRDDLAAAGVQQEGALPHLADLLLADQVDRGGEVRHVQGDEIRSGEELLHGGHLRRVAHGQLGDDVVVDHLHAHGLRAHRQLRADVAVADEAEGLAADLEAAHRLLEPGAAMHGGRAVADLAGQADDVPDDELRHAAGVREGGVEDRDALRLRGLQIDLVGADAEAAHRQHLVHRRDDLRGDLGLAADAEDVQALDLLEELGLGERRLHGLNREALSLEHLDAVGSDSLEKEDLDLVLGEREPVLRPLGVRLGRRVAGALLADGHHGFWVRKAS
mmetsp:Transcript_2767/g.7745  ORF Transcript_2767/g.7745 Transcript_2767/m.7745 type:complete len:439 (-) Transcript_2767:31-1347(-)